MARDIDQRIYNVGQRIRQIRMEKGMSQTDLALAMDTTKNVISKWELGCKVMRLDSLYNLSDTLEVSPHLFLQDIEKPEDEINLNREIESLNEEQKQFILRTVRTLLKGLQV